MCSDLVAHEVAMAAMTARELHRLERLRRARALGLLLALPDAYDDVSRWTPDPSLSAEPLVGGETI
jgi:hypothetical protein